MALGIHVAGTESRLPLMPITRGTVLSGSVLSLSLSHKTSKFICHVLEFGET